MVFENLKDSIKEFTGLAVADKEAVNKLVKNIQRDLIRADVDIGLVKNLSETIKERALKQDLPKGLTRKEHVLNIVYEELSSILGDEKASIDINPKKILMIGLFGAGKTTTSAKLADFYRKRGLKSGLIAADVHRPAAYEQLQQNAEKSGAEFYGEKNSKNAGKIVKKGLKALSDCDVIITDSAGRDSMNKELEKELKSIEKHFKPDETLLVVPADIGQSAKEQAETFNKAVGIDGVIVTKMDSSAKGGGALSSCAAANTEIKFIGTGEGIGDLEIYDPESFVSDLLGVPDLSKLLEKARESIDEEKAKQILEGDFTLKDFYEQMEQMSSMGGFDKIIDKLPFGNKLPDNVMDMQEKQLKKYRHIMDSMTEQEMKDPKLINSSRAERISDGSGTEKKEVRQMIKQYRQAKNMMDKFSGKNMRRGNMKKMMRQFGMR